MDPGYEVEARLLGAPELQIGGERHRPEAAKSAFVVFFLAAEGGWIARERLATLLWDDGSDARALRNLRQLLHRARRGPYASAVEIESGRVRFRGCSDLAVFREAAAEEDWRRALELHRGPFLDGWAFPSDLRLDAWIVGRREEIAVSRRWGLTECAGRLETKDPLAAAELYGEIWRDDVLDEEAVRRQLVCLQRGGRFALAAAAAEHYRAALERDLDVQPDGAVAETLRRAEARRPLADAIDPPKGAPEGPLNRAGRPRQLPAPHAALIGRRAELHDLETRLAEGATRLVSMVGLGGSGKTRLALEVAQRARERGVPVAWASLVGRRSHGEVVREVAAAWGVGEAEADPLGRVEGRIGEQAALTVIDNAETSPTEVAALAGRLLTACGGARILVTSRRVLGIRAEQVVHLGGLMLRDAGASGPASEARAFLLAFARRRDSAFGAEVEGETLEAICRAVGGTPLALELIGSWAATLTPDAMLAEVRDAPLELQPGDVGADLPQRQRSLGSVLGATWAQLSAAGREALLALAPCGGSVAFSDARALGVPLEGLRELTASALLRRAGSRLVSHPVVARFARERAERHPDRRAGAEARHGAHFLAKLSAVDEDTPQTRIDELRADVANLRRALLWAAEDAGDDVFVGALYRLRLLEGFLGLPADPDYSYRLRQRARGRGRVHVLMREVWERQLGSSSPSVLGERPHVSEAARADTRELVDAALAEARALGDPRLERRVLHEVASFADDPREVFPILQRAWALSTDGWEFLLTSAAAHAHASLGQHRAARVAFLRGVVWICRSSRPFSQTVTVHNIVLLDLARGRYDDAARVAEAIGAHLLPDAPRRWRIEAAVAAARVAAARGQLAAATAGFDRALAWTGEMAPFFRREQGAFLRGEAAHVATLRGDFAAAAVALEPLPEGGYGSLFRGRLALASGAWAEARTHLERAAADLPLHASDVWDAADHLRARSWLALTLVGEREPEGARREARAALGAALDLRLPVELLRALLALARARHGAGARESAAGLLELVRAHPASDADTRILAGGTSSPRSGPWTSNPLFELATELHRGS